MTNTPPEPAPPDPASAAPAKPAHGGRWEQISLALQVLASLALAGGVLAYLAFGGRKPPESDDTAHAAESGAVQVAGPRTIRIQSGTPLDGELKVATARQEWLTAPILPVTGTALVSLRPGTEVAHDAWQFATPDLLNAFSDWQKAVVDVQFQETQLKAVRDLNEARVKSQKEVVGRMEKLVAAGTDTQKDLVAERTNLIQYEIQGRKDVHDQENAVTVSKRTAATLARQLQQAGLEPTLLRSTAIEGDIVVAEVPERLMDRVKLGMQCEVRFYALPHDVYTGKVSGIAPVISKEKRVLNVQFVVKDPDNRIRPGMFAVVGLGTDRRPAILMPADGVLHVEDSDYALAGGEGGLWTITAVQVGELRGADVEILSGVKAGDHVLGQGAILIKPVVMRCLQPTEAPPKTPAPGPQPGGRDR